MVIYVENITSVSWGLFKGHSIRETLCSCRWNVWTRGARNDLESLSEIDVSQMSFVHNNNLSRRFLLTCCADRGSMTMAIVSVTTSDITWRVCSSSELWDVCYGYYDEIWQCTQKNTTMTWKRFPYYWPFCEGVLPATSGFPSQRAKDAELWCLF